MATNRLETVESLAERFGLPSRTIVREVLRCRLPYVSIAGNWRFRERDVALWVRGRGPFPQLQLLEGDGNETAGRQRPRRSARGVG